MGLCNPPGCLGELQSQKTAKDAKSAKQRKDKKQAVYPPCFSFFLGVLVALGGSKIDFAILLAGCRRLLSRERRRVKLSFCVPWDNFLPP